MRVLLPAVSSNAADPLTRIGGPAFQRVPVRRPIAAAPGRLAAAVLALITLASGCDSEVYAPDSPAGLSLDLAELDAGARAAGVATDNVVVVLRRVADSSVAFKQNYPDDLLGQVTGTRIVRARVPLRVSPEDFLLHLEVVGGGTVYYALDTRVTVIAGVGVTTPPLSLEYVGPGRSADSLAFVLLPPLILPGDSVLAAAVVLERGLPLAGVPVSYSSSDTAMVRVRPSGLGLAWLVAAPDAAGTVSITAATPTGLSRSAGLTVLVPAPTAAGAVQAMFQATVLP
jgi:hypothetical protein